MPILLILFIIWIVYMINNSNSGSGNQVQAGNPEIQVHCRKETVINPDDPHLDSIEVLHVSIKGLLVVPRDNYPVKICIYAQDVTDGLRSDYFLTTSVPELSNNEGTFIYTDDFIVPYQQSTWDQYTQIATIPLSFLKTPRRGNRRVAFYVSITEQFNVKQSFVLGSYFIDFYQKSNGYLDLEEGARNLIPKIAALALCIAALDGSIDSSEKAKIKEIIKELSLNGDLKEEVNHAVKTTTDALNSRQKAPLDLIHDISDELRSFAEESLSRKAYEICVHVAVADGKVEQNEELALKHLARTLCLSNDFVKETHDIHIRSSMYDGKSTESVLGVPHQLSHKEKIAWINEEYKKWRGRANSKNPEVAKEASARLKMLSDYRTELNSQQRVV